MGRPEPSKALAETFVAGSRFRKVIVPVTGSIRVGALPRAVRRVRSASHCMAVFSTRPHAVRSNLPALAMGLDSRELTTMAQNSFLTSAERFETCSKQHRTARNKNRQNNNKGQRDSSSRMKRFESSNHFESESLSCLADIHTSPFDSSKPEKAHFIRSTGVNAPERGRWFFIELRLSQSKQSFHGSKRRLSGNQHWPQSFLEPESPPVIAAHS